MQQGLKSAPAESSPQLPDPGADPEVRSPFGTYQIDTRFAGGRYILSPSLVPNASWNAGWLMTAVLLVTVWWLARRGEHAARSRRDDTDGR